MNTVPVGLHFFVEIKANETYALFNDSQQLEDVLRTIAETSGMTVIKEATHSFNPIGVTSILLLEESHISIHTWPENNYAAMDIFTCNISTDRTVLKNTIQQHFPNCEIQFNVVERGFSV